MAQSRYYSSNAQPTTLAAGTSTSDVSCQVAATVGFPGSFPYVLALDYGTASEELVTVTSAAGTTLTITRAFDGTSAATHSAGAPVRHVWCGADGNDSRAHEAALASVHGVVGDVVGTMGGQTLSSKTLTTPIINGATLNGTLSGSPTFSGNPVFSGIGQVLFARKTATQTVQSTTSVTDADLVVAMSTNSTYRIMGAISYLTDPAADFVIQRTIPANTTCALYVTGLSGNYASDTASVRMVGSSNTTTTFGHTLTAGVSVQNTILLDGLVRTGVTAGNFQILWGQSVSTAANTSVFIDSYIELRRVA